MTRGRLAQTTIALVSVALTLAACGNNGTPRSTSKTLRTAFSADPSPLDPDTYYESEGTLVTTSAYEGLLRYRPNSPQIEGLLAQTAVPEEIEAFGQLVSRWHYIGNTSITDFALGANKALGHGWF